MNIKSKDTGQLLELEDDPRWQLVERIVASPSFAKTERLSSFLTCVCQLVQTSQFQNINEQYIGAAVFGRSPDYDPGVDSIVRSHASRLRHRLQQYFDEEGADEELVLTIPKGGYVPLFERRTGLSEALDVPRVAPDWATASHPSSRFETPQPVSASASLEAASAPNTGSRRRSILVVSLLILLAVVALAAGTYLGRVLLERRRATAAAANGNEGPRLFWGSLFNTRQKTIVVNADSGLVILQGLTKRRVTLDSYLSGDYLKDPTPYSIPPELTRNLGMRRYTSIVDLRIMNHIFRMPDLQLDKTQFRYARDIRMDEIKQGNLLLLGTYESTPWVQLFEPAMNFYFQNDLAAGNFSIVNRNPQPGEQPRYDSVNSDPKHTVYGVVAYRPTLSGSGKVLILEGQSMAGTETASDFVFDDGYLAPFLKSIRRPDGSIPYFELLLRSMSMNVEASRLEIVAFRVEDR